MEERHIRRVLEKMGWNISKTARRLEIDRQTLYNKIQKYGISQDK
jgi:two-component system response regulator HydG